MNKLNTLTITKTWPESTPFRSHWRELVDRIKRMVEVPVGYEDEAGFHYGYEPKRKVAGK